jgi:hypothetical protein
MSSHLLGLASGYRETPWSGSGVDEVRHSFHHELRINDMPTAGIIACKAEVYIPAQQQGAPQRADERGERTMKIMLRAALAAASIASIGSAYAGEGEAVVSNTQFTEIPGVVAQAPAQNAPAVATAQNGQAVPVYVTRSNQGTWLFAPNGNAGANS